METNMKNVITAIIVPVVIIAVVFFAAAWASVYPAPATVGVVNMVAIIEIMLVVYGAWMGVQIHRTM